MRLARRKHQRVHEAVFEHGERLYDCMTPSRRSRRLILAEVVGYFILRE